MRLRSSFGSLGVVYLSFALAPLIAGCSDPIELVYPRGSGGVGGAGVGGGSGGSGGSSIDVTVGSGGSGQGGSGGSGPSCVPACSPGLHCEDVKGVATCVPDCDVATNAGCVPNKELCEPLPNGGASCADNSCDPAAADPDAKCPPEKYCDLAGGYCVPDVCTPGARTCVAQDLHECLPNGSADPLKYTCGSQSYYQSMCVDPGDGSAYCGCEDDWDCPADTVCFVDQCSGTGKAPTCVLSPVPFAQALPAHEFTWGGTGIVNKNAVGAPFPASAQSSMTPLVANLDDDNGDGLINELDFPEIIFVTYCNQEITTNGIVRALHGGGPNKGKDFFASAGANVWHEGDDINKPYACSDGVANSTGAIAVGDLDGDGVPEIVVPTEASGLQILSNTGVPITATASNQWSGFANPSVAIANVDDAGLAELVVGNVVFTLGHDAANALIFVDKFVGSLNAGKQTEGPVSCVGNVAGDARQEIIAGSTAYALPAPPAGVTKRADCAVGAMDDFCLGKLSVVWDATAVNGVMLLPDAQKDGLCSVADVLGADQAAAPGPLNPLDGAAEVALISEGYVVVLNGQTGQLARLILLDAGVNADGGAPNVDDFDGDGFPEIGTALASKYVMIDLQDPAAMCPLWPNTLDDSLPPGMQGNPARAPGGACTMDNECAAGAVCNKVLGSCVCLYNGWARITEDDSSKVTASSVFDFNGDGAAEVIYNDECFFRIYDGTNGDNLFKEFNPSRTRIENPVVADVDNDGNAEIVSVSNNEAAFCSTGVDYPNGLQVWGDANDAWVSARRIWNEHAYHVTNVLEGGGLPVKEPESWKTYNERVYNTYRSNPRSYGIAPDLQVPSVQVSSPDATCGQLSSNLDITAQISNLGDLRVGPGVVVKFYGEWSNPALVEPLYADAAQTPLTSTIQTSIEPGGSIFVTVSYKASNNAPNVLPDKVRVVVDETSAAAPFGKERECIENNNDRTQPVDGGMNLPDLRIVVSAKVPCPPTVTATIFNDGSAPASGILVRIYQGDPAQGGQAKVETIVPGPIPPGGNESVMLVVPGLPAIAGIKIYGVVDPDNTIQECNDGNNTDEADKPIDCSSG